MNPIAHIPDVESLVLRLPLGGESRLLVPSEFLEVVLDDFAHLLVVSPLRVPLALKLLLFGRSVKVLDVPLLVHKYLLEFR